MRILVVEDGDFARELIAMQLASLGHHVETAATGTEGWERIETGDFEVVISDLMMPGMTGVELCRKLRAEPRERYTYFILLTAVDDPEQFLEGMEAGADDYLDKTSEPGVLKARLLVAERFTRLHGELSEKARLLASANQDLKRLNGDLHRLSRHDALTGLGNRLFLKETLGQLRGMAERYQRRFSAAIFDIDYFKKFNDTYGHLAGDEILNRVATILNTERRGADMLFRYGGEEFLIILPECPIEHATLPVERIRTAVLEAGIPHRASPLGMVTVSAGIAELEPARSVDVEGWLKAADDALYEAKQAGRNRVVVASS